MARPSVSTHPSIHPSRCPTSAFTLIELVVVVAGICILAALILPRVIHAMRPRRAADCKSNLRQISAAFMLYAKCYGGFMCPSGAPPKYTTWDRGLEPFAIERQVYQCPEKRRAQVGYGLNDMWCGPDEIYGDGTAMSRDSKPTTQVRNPSGTIILCDMGLVTNIDDPPDEWIDNDGPDEGLSVRFPYDNLPDQPGKYTCWVTSPRRPVPRHPGAKTHCLFFDGHVEGITTIDVVDDLWDEPGCLYDNDGSPRRPY